MKWLGRTILVVVATVLAGCGTKAGVIFPPHKPPLLWPSAPETPRIRYVGQLATSADLKPAVSGMESLGHALFGKKGSRSMLTPYAVCTNGKGRVFVADSNAQVIHVFDLNTRKYDRWELAPDKTFAQPVGIAYDTLNDRLFVADSVAKTVYLFTSMGGLVEQTPAGLFERPTGLCFDRQNQRLFVADTGAHRVVVCALNCQPITRFGERGDRFGQFNFPTNIAIDRQGIVYVCDSLNFRVQQFTPDLKPIRIIGQKGDLPGYFGQPKGVACDSQNHLYVVDANFEAIQIFDPSGQLLLNFGEEGSKAGEFWLPTGICIDSGDRIWVADSYNRRLQVFDYLKDAGR